MAIYHKCLEVSTLDIIESVGFYAMIESMLEYIKIECQAPYQTDDSRTEYYRIIHALEIINSSNASI